MSELPLPPTRRTLGTSDLSISPLAWGMWRSTGSAADVGRLLHVAIEAGIDLVDTADIYGWKGKDGFGTVEALLGDVLRAEPSLRNRLTLATKGGISLPIPYDQSRAYMEKALDASLARLGVEHIDLYFIHRPDILTHPQELARFLDDAVASGKVQAIGVSNFTPSQIETLAGLLNTPLAATQPEISPLRIDPLVNGEADQAMRLGLVPMAWSPLAGGRIMTPQSERERAVASALDEFAEGNGVDRAVAAYGWLMAHPAGIVPIIGSQSPERLAQATQALTLRWTREQWYKILVAARGVPLP